MAEQRMDEATRARLLSLMPCASSGTYEWTPEAYKEKSGEDFIIPKEQWPVFSVRSMTTQEHTALRKMVLSRANFDKTKPDQLIELSDSMHESVRKLVTGWKGVVDVISGEEYTYEQDPSGGALKDKWNRMPDILKSELFQQVCRMSGLIKVDGDDRMELSRKGF